MYRYSILILILFVITACNSGSKSPTTGGTPSESIPSGPTYTVTGTITYARVPITTGGLNYSGTLTRPVRNVKIQARNPSGNGLLANGTTDDSGNFSLKIPQSASSFYINVIAQMSSPNITIEDNTNSNAIYLVQSNNYPNSGDQSLSNIHLPSGWTGSNASGNYTSQRYAAPFAILDTIYSGYKKLLGERPSLSIPPLKVNWSVNNYASETYHPSTGAIGTSHYDGNELYILGKDSADTDEYDTHVVIHEWGHFIEDKLSRSDSLGGQHGSGDKLNMSVAFGEGFGNALSAIILDPEITYLDSMGTRQQYAPIAMNMENGTNLNPGWFSEASVQQLVFDIYDSNVDGADNVSLGFGPIIDVLTGPQKSTTAFTSIFSFIWYLKSQNPGSASAIDNLVSDKNIDPVNDIYGSGETHDGGDPETLPIFKLLTHGSSPYSFSMGGGSFRMNQMRNNRFFRFTANSTSTRLELTCNDYCILGVWQAGAYLTEGYSSSNQTSIINVPTVAGREYAVLVTTDGYFTETDATINASLRVY